MADLNGTLKACGAPSLLQLAEWQSWTGVLTCGPTEIHFRGGLPVHAQVGEHSGRSALLEWFFEDEGDFSFDAEAEVLGGSPLGNSTDLVMEALRLMDEWRRISAKVVRGSVPGLDITLGTGLPLWQVVPAAGVLRAEVVEDLLDAVQDGTLETMGEDIPEGSLPEGNPEDLLLDARKMVRTGDYERAELLLRQVLLLSPGHPIAAQNLRRLNHLRSR